MFCFNKTFRCWLFYGYRVWIKTKLCSTHFCESETESRPHIFWRPKSKNAVQYSTVEKICKKQHSMKDVRKASSPPENIQHFTKWSFFNLSFFRLHEIQIHWPNSIWILIPWLLFRSELIEERLKQFCESESGSVGSGSFHHQTNIVRKTSFPTVLWPLFDFLSLKNDVNVRYFQKVRSRKTFF